MTGHTMKANTPANFAARAACGVDQAHAHACARAGAERPEAAGPARTKRGGDAGARSAARALSFPVVSASLSLRVVSSDTLDLEALEDWRGGAF